MLNVLLSVPISSFDWISTLDVKSPSVILEAVSFKFEIGLTITWVRKRPIPVAKTPAIMNRKIETSPRLERGWRKMSLGWKKASSQGVTLT
jgi:hypothetical protein